MTGFAISGGLLMKLLRWLLLPLMGVPAVLLASIFFVVNIFVGIGQVAMVYVGATLGVVLGVKWMFLIVPHLKRYIALMITLPWLLVAYSLALNFFGYMAMNQPDAYKALDMAQNALLFTAWLLIVALFAIKIGLKRSVDLREFS